MELKDRIIEYISNESFNKESIEMIANALSIDAFSFKPFMKAINELLDEGILYQSSKGMFYNSERLNIYVGTLTSLKKYYGIITLKDDREITIYNEHLANAYLNDKVRIHTNKDGTGEIMEVINHSLWKIIAIYSNHKFIVKERNFPFELRVKRSDLVIKNDHLVLLHIDKYDDLILHCSIIKDLGSANDPDSIELSSILKSNVRYEFDNNLISETNKMVISRKEKFNEEIKNRVDLTSKLIVTIDGKEAKDLDDAISIEMLDNGNYYLGVHIADVSYYVVEDSILDKEAFSRGTSIYLPDKVIPMLPEIISNGVCSLNMGEIKLTISCFMEINNDGEVINYEITPSYINSKGRLNYDEVNDLFNNKETNLSKDIKEMLLKGKDLSDIISNRLVKDGYISLNVAEPKIIIDEKTNKVVDIKIRETYQAEKLIENFMIMANQTVASAIFYMDLPFIYRVHPEISKEKLETLASFLNDLGYNINSKQTYVSSKVLQDVLNKCNNNDNSYVVNDMMLRSMSKAYYSITNIGHFGLGLKNYTHFTSPIRRYPDLIVHRYLRKYLFDSDYTDSTSKLDMIALNSSVKERNAMALEREVDDIKKAEYMSNFIGQVFEGIVSGILDFGCFVKLSNTAEGLLRYENIECYDYNAYNKLIKNMKVGDKLFVSVLSVNISDGEINFAYVGKKQYNKIRGKNEKVISK